MAANGLKEEFEKDELFQSFITHINQASSRLRQTAFSYLCSPKLRSKGRFMGISRLGAWAQQLLGFMKQRGRAKKGSTLEKVRELFLDLKSYHPFLQRFCQTTEVVAQMMKLLKKEGLNDKSAQQCRQMIDQLESTPKLQSRLKRWVDEHCQYRQQLNISSLPVSTDCIESLFGKYKYIISRSPHQDINRSALLIPLLCGQNLDRQELQSAFGHVSQKDLPLWCEEQIPYTQLQRKKEFKREIREQKLGTLIAANA